MIDKPDEGASGPRTPREPAGDTGNRQRPPGAQLQRELDQFIKHVNSLDETLPLAMLAIQAGSKVAIDNYNKFVRDHCSVEKKEDHTVIRFDADRQEQFNRLRNRRERAGLAYRLVPRSLIVALVSQYDAFIGGLIRCYYKLHPDALNSSERNVTLAQLDAFGSIDAAKEFILEKEVESVLRKSHSEQFDWMEARFDMPLRKGLDSWPTFIEITERRNLFVHTSGVISSQYLAICQKHGVRCDVALRPGHSLNVTPAYFAAAYECIYEIAVKLGHVFWRKMLPNDRENADDHLIGVTYELLSDGSHRLAKELLDFAFTTLKKFSTEQHRRVLIVNRAQAYKWLGDIQGASRIMKTEDWSASSDEFRLADLVLGDQFDAAAGLMRSIGQSGKVSRIEYASWPLFREFRKSQAFLTAYEQVFGEPFNVLAQPANDRPAEDESSEADREPPLLGEDGSRGSAGPGPDAPNAKE